VKCLGRCIGEPKFKHIDKSYVHREKKLYKNNRQNIKRKVWHFVDFSCSVVTLPAFPFLKLQLKALLFPFSIYIFLVDFY